MAKAERSSVDAVKKAANGQPPDKAGASRAALLDVATQMFAKQGYVETSMRDIAKGAALTTGALYGNFRNKADLLAEAISNRIKEQVGGNQPEAVDAQHIRESLYDFVANYHERQELRALILQGAAAAQTDEVTRARLRDEQRRHLDGWIAGYQNERDNLEIDPAVDVEAAVLFTWAAEIGLGVLEVVGILPNPEGWMDAYKRLLRGLTLPAE